MDASIPTIRVDYHFHPNLPRRDGAAQRKIARLYERFAHGGISAVLITEHVYKDPLRAWRMMRAQQPEGITVFPGLEYLTKEGIDVCLFAETDAIYTYSWVPYALSYEDVLDFLAQHPDVRGFVTHPYTLGTTSIITKKGLPFTKEAIARLGSVECTYSVFRDLKKLLGIPLVRWLAASVLSRIELNEKLPEALHPAEARFFAIGSDAHQVWEIGPCAEVIQKETLFASIVGNTTIRAYGIDQGALWRLVPAALTTIHEWFQKRLTAYSTIAKRPSF
ncbi:MAG: hypothetical protein KBE09_02510 [Candidatus Pacebacteria bacterium]|nr:hypothetical protein [Candidatus Paceibacterota bacterium]